MNLLFLLIGMVSMFLVPISFEKGGIWLALLNILISSVLILLGCRYSMKRSNI